MPEIAELDLPVVDPTDPGLAGPGLHAALRDLRARHWAAAIDPVGYLVLDRDGVDAVLRSREARVPVVDALRAQGVGDSPLLRMLDRNLLNLEGDEHRRMRGQVQRAFAPRAVEGWRPAMRRHVEELLDAVPSGEEVDFVAAVARPYPARVIAEVVGAPQRDAERLADWAHWLQAGLDPAQVATDLPRIEAAAKELRDYVAQLMDRRDDTDDLAGHLVAAHRAGELSHEECLALIAGVLVGGIDTTQAQLAHAVRLLAEHPEHWRVLVEDPTAAPAAVEEALRHEPATPFTARLTAGDLDVHGVTFPAGTLVVACQLTANHEGDDAWDFDLAAEHGHAWPLTFGAGPHHCLGAALATAELQEALAALAQRFERLEPAGDPEFDTPFGVHAVRRLPIRLGD